MARVFQLVVKLAQVVVFENIFSQAVVKAEPERVLEAIRAEVPLPMRKVPAAAD